MSALIVPDAMDRARSYTWITAGSSRRVCTEISFNAGEMPCEPAFSGARAAPSEYRAPSMLARCNMILSFVPTEWGVDDAHGVGLEGVACRSAIAPVTRLATTMTSPLQ